MMLIRKRPGWYLPDSMATPESAYVNRRALVKGLAAGSILASSGAMLAACDSQESGATSQAHAAEEPWADLYPVEQNPKYELDRPITDEHWATTYNNFYEFGSHKNIWKAAQKLPIQPWAIEIDGLVEKPMTLDADALIRQMPLEERLYRHRCVEAWSMAVPWSGFPLKAMVDWARPLADAKYLVMQTFMDPGVAPGQRQSWYPWPYTEGLTMAEATNELAFMVTGLYGKPLPRQNGSPLRLAVPWKYGFKSIKSISRFTFSDTRPKTFWEELAPREYGFWANVNPEVTHPRWSQASEKVLGEDRRVPTILYNGYGEFVEHLYEGLEDERLFA